MPWHRKVWMPIDVHRNKGFDIFFSALLSHPKLMILFSFLLVFKLQILDFVRSGRVHWVKSGQEDWFKGHIITVRKDFLGWSHSGAKMISAIGHQIHQRSAEKSIYVCMSSVTLTAKSGESLQINQAILSSEKCLHRHRNRVSNLNITKVNTVEKYV